MSEPAKRLDLKLVDENFVADAKAPPADKLMAERAAAIREGKRRLRAELGSQATLAVNAIAVSAQRVTELTQAHEAHLKAGQKASFHQGVTYASMVWLPIAAACLLAGAWLQTSGWSMSVADERIPRASPQLTYEPNSNTDYERNPREPATARN